MPENTAVETIDIEFTGPLKGGMGPSSWTVVLMPNSAEIFGTRKPVKVAGEIDGYPFAATLLPLGDGVHMVPIKAALKKQVNKVEGDIVTVHLTERLS